MDYLKNIGRIFLESGIGHAMFEHRDTLGSQYRTYLIAADEFELNEGDRLQPGSEIGIDVNSGIPIYADYWGHVATVYYNPMSQSLLVMIFRESQDKGELQSEFRELITAPRC